MTEKLETAFSKGLEDIVAAESSICQIDGINSHLWYRGYDIHDLAVNSNFEETAYLLIFGSLPTQKQLTEFNAKLAAERELPKEMFPFIERFPKTVNPMAALRTSVSLLSFFDAEADDKSLEANLRKTYRLIARVPAIVAAIDRVRRGSAIVAPKLDPQMSTAANFLYMKRGRDATPAEARILDQYFILLTEHDLNASTFTGRTTASTESDIYSAITSAIGALKGDLHGSANSRTMESLIKIDSVDKVEAFVDDALAQKKKLMGFGHRVYKGPDPRADDLRRMAESLAKQNPDQAKWFAISQKLEKVVLEKKKLNCNVDFYSASVLYTLGIPVDMFTTMFAISRMAGWTAHILEQYADNRLIRPVSQYVGKTNQTYMPLKDRK